uniref:Nuclear receptor domain-containing protein n=1 Tax=Meloidogyne incognita TaxID=6306 RepID=A0A914KUA9_MELIC
MQRDFIKKCKVCGAKENVLFHYGVCSCRACGSFFRTRRAERAESNSTKNSFRIHLCACISCQ